MDRETVEGKKEDTDGEREKERERGEESVMKMGVDSSLRDSVINWDQVTSSLSGQ